MTQPLLDFWAEAADERGRSWRGFWSWVLPVGRFCGLEGIIPGARGCFLSSIPPAT